MDGNPYNQLIKQKPHLHKKGRNHENS
jgi:hypothetical protein